MKNIRLKMITDTARCYVFLAKAMNSKLYLERAKDTINLRVLQFQKKQVDNEETTSYRRAA